MKPSQHAVLCSLFGITDEQAMWRVATEDDEAAFAMLMRRWEAPIQRLCAHMTGDSHHAEDLAQETFAHAFARRKNYESKGKVSTWLWRIALNLCYDELRRRRRRQETPLDDTGAETVPLAETLAGPEMVPDASLVEKESAELVRQALLQLTESQRAVLVLRHYQDLKFREIAAVLEIPEGTVKSRMVDALTVMSRMLKKTLTTAPVKNTAAEHKSKESLMI
jgi:RNA polymerase sigma-70 factor (ECF subfamily)